MYVLLNSVIDAADSSCQINSRYTRVAMKPEPEETQPPAPAPPPSGQNSQLLSTEAATDLRRLAATVFSPRGPVTTKELFSGRWTQIETLLNTFTTPGLHVVIYGERGVGKTSLANIIPAIVDVADGDLPEPKLPRIVIRVNGNASDSFSSIWNKIFSEISWTEQVPRLGFDAGTTSQFVNLKQAMQLGDNLSIDDVRRTIALLPRAVFVIDEFDRIPKRNDVEFTDLIKSLSDLNIPATVVVVGIAETVDDLAMEHASINRALIQILMPRMSMPELAEIITKGEEKLGVFFDADAKNKIVRLSQGLPHYTHLVGLHAVQHASRRLSRSIISSDVVAAFQSVVRDVDHTISSDWQVATRSAQSDALYNRVLVACAVTAATHGDSNGFFQPASVVASLSMILKKRVEISTFNRHLTEFCESHRRNVLERTGRERSYRYRFSNPLMPPYAMMLGVNQSLISAEDIESLMAGSDRAG